MSDRRACFSRYFKDLFEVSRRGDAREEIFYPALASMLKTMADATGRKHVSVTTLPKPTEAGNPDFRLWNGKDRIVGYVEAKNPAEERLDAVEESEQLARYRATFPNLLLTNFFEFRLYRNGERVATVLAARPFVLHRLGTPPPVERPDELHALLDRFLGYSLPRAFDAETLAAELAKRTRFFREVVARQLEEEKAAPGVLTGFFEAFETYLIGALSPEAFADLFAQTIAYGLFAARTRAANGFSRREAFDNIPHTIGVLRDLFRFVSLGDLPEQLAWCVDDIAEVLAVADVRELLDRYFREGKGDDPIVHFYETFLAHYDPAERERRGVYYTPEPVVAFIVRSLHEILKTDFDQRDGLASEGVTLLDPAAGTMTFVARAAREAVAEFEKKYGAGGREDFIRRHILKNFFAFELMMAPYAVGHLKMGFFLEELGHRLADDERMPFYLTNTLDHEELQQSRLPGLSSLAEESRLAGEIKKKTRVLVVLGNPPYSGISSNTGEWITGLIEDYKYVDGKHFGEKKHWLQDDYVKFLRFAQWKIEQAGCGVVGMITNHGYLDNPTFRGMRQSLLRTFDDIYVLDLHGNSLKREVAPDGTPDKNVFDIRQGVAIAFFLKRDKQTKAVATVRHADLWGLRETKHRWLTAHDRKSVRWKKLSPKSPSYFFIPRNDLAEKTYKRFVPISDLFSLSVTGIVTARDGFVFDFDKEALLRRIGQFRNPAVSDDLLQRSFSLKDTRGWKMSDRRRDMAQLSEWRDFATPCLYRPFDIRSLYYHPYMVDWGRPEFMSHMLAGKNLAMVLPKRVEHVGSWQHVFVTRHVSDHVAVSLKTVDYHFPLYLYPEETRRDLFVVSETGEPRPNLDPKWLAALAEAHGKTPAPEAVFQYVYAILHTPIYRTKFAEFLRMDFPRIPFTASAKLFARFAALGAKLIALHLLESPDLDPPLCRFEGRGDNRVAKNRKEGLRYDADAQRVHINATQYFAPVPEAVWSFPIGGYRVCEKWLKDRRERRLELDDIRTYCRIATALARTLELRNPLDALYPEIEETGLDALMP